MEAFNQLLIGRIDYLRLIKYVILRQASKESERRICQILHGLPSGSLLQNDMLCFQISLRYSIEERIPFLEHVKRQFRDEFDHLFGEFLAEFLIEIRIRGSRRRKYCARRRDGPEFILKR